MPSVGLWFASLCGVLLFIWGVFAGAEKVASPAVKASVRQWLKSANPAMVAFGWLSTFVQVFDRLFDERLLSWKCFRRSCLASLGTVLVVTLYWAARRPLEALAAFSGGRAQWTVLSFTILTIAVSLLPDYLSLIKARVLIGWMNRKPRVRRLVAGVALDLLLTLVLVWVSWYFWLFIQINTHVDWRYPIGLALRLPIYLTVVHMLMASQLSAAPGYLPVGIWPWATLFTTAWATLYAIAGALMILARYAGFGLAMARCGLDIDGQPVLSLGVVAMGLLTFVYLAAWLSVQLVK
jgi:hypothetical protein